MAKKHASYKPVLRVGFGEDTFDIVKLMASEVSKIQLWTGIPSKRKWIEALGQEDIEAFKAAYTLMRQRAGDEVRFSEVDFDTDELSVEWIDPSTGDGVHLLLKTDDSGEQVVDGDGDPVPVMEDGQPVWLFDETEERVPLRPTSPE